MPKADPVLFRVLLEKSRNELDPDFIGNVARRTKTCVQELLAAAGYEARLSLTAGQSGDDWHLTVHAEQRLLMQLDMFHTKCERPTVAQASRDVIEAAVIAIARFRRETGGVAAASLHETLKQLKSADPRVIAAIAKHPGRKLTVRQDDTDLELSIQSDSHRTVSLETQTLKGAIVAVGYSEMSVLPSNRRSTSHLCIHPARVKIPKDLRTKFDPLTVLVDLVQTGTRVELLVQPEVVVRKRQHVTYLLAQWPPATTNM